MNTKLRALVSLLMAVCVADGYRILAIMPIRSLSHHFMMDGVLRALVKAGHHVTKYSRFPISESLKNYTEILVENEISSPDIGELAKNLVTKTTLWFLWENRVDHLSVYDGDKMIMDIKEMHYSNQYNIIHQKVEIYCYEIFKTDKIQSLIRSKEKYDLIITEQFFGMEAYSILGHIFKAPMIAIHCLSTNEVLNSVAGNSLSIASLPYILSPFSNEMDFWERSLNAYAILRGMYIYYYDYLPKIDTRMRKHFPDMPPLLDMLRSTSLYFVNDHQTTDYSNPRPPNIIPVGGIHFQPIGRLPEDLQSFMDEATEGVILFSLGTLFPDQLQSKEYFDMYLSAFRRLTQKVIWKTKKADMEGFYTNVIVRNWVPQQEILAHQNCVLFVTHGGLNSLLETVLHGVPVVVIPQLFDQYRNAKYFETRKVGIKLEDKDLSEESLYKTIQTVIEDKRYRRNMVRLSAVFRDRPVSAARTVVYWAEYVVRHAGAPHLRPIAATMPWYQRASLDVAAAFILIIVSISSTILSFSYYLIRCLHR